MKKDKPDLIVVHYGKAADELGDAEENLYRLAARLKKIAPRNAILLARNK